MSRYLILILLVVAVWWMVRGERRAAIRRHERRAAAQQSKAEARIEGEAMVACAQCDLHLPVSEAVAGHALDDAGHPQRWFCGEAHRALYDKRVAMPATDVHR